MVAQSADQMVYELAAPSVAEKGAVLVEQSVDLKVDWWAALKDALMVEQKAAKKATTLADLKDFLLAENWEY